MSWWWEDSPSPPADWVEQIEPNDDFDPYYHSSVPTFSINEPPLLLASTVHPQVRDILSNESFKGKELGNAMIQAIDIQMRLHAEQDVRYREIVDERDEDIVLSITQPGSGDGKDNVLPSAPDSRAAREGQPPPTLFAQAAARVAIELGKASKEETQAIAKRVPHVATSEFKSIVWKLPRLPYTVFSQALQNAAKVETTRATAKASEPDGADVRAGDIDEWIIRNEKYMRARLVLDQPREQESTASPTDDDPIPYLSQLGIDKSASHWKEYMVGLGRDAKRVLVESELQDASSSTIRIQRPEKADLPGLLIIDQYRKDAIEINTLSAFQSRFESMTFEALKGLDWSNVLVAGGIALAALTGVTDPEASASESSDVDLYLYGLTVDQANAKLQEIEKVFVSNLPLDNDTGKPIKYAVLRNAQTINFVPGRYPYRRVQVVLKLCSNPMAILLNFDLDQVAIGYTGDEVWMLPRASRALVTGYTTFTMDLIHGSFLAPRKATQDQRVFKYGERGYGLRFLPSYIKALSTVSLNQKTTTERDVPEQSLPRDELNVTLREERARVAWWLAQRYGAFISPLEKREVRMYDVTLTCGNDTPELAEKSSMSGWQLFARHVALWELAQLGYCQLKEHAKQWGWGSEYVDDTLSYDDAPDYVWDHEFTLDKLEHAVNRLNQSDEENLRNTLDRSKIPYRIRGKYGELVEVEDVKKKMRLDHRMPLRRHIVASSLRETLQQPLVCGVHLPKNLRAHVEEKLQPEWSRFVDVVQLQPEPEDPPAKARLKPVFSPYGEGADGGDEAGDRGYYDEEDYEDEEDEYPGEDDYSSDDVDYDNHGDEIDTGFILSYWIQGSETFSSPTLDNTESSSKPHWQLVSRELDEIYEVLHAFRRAHRDLRMPIKLRNQSLRRQVGRRLVRPTERSERDAFVRWAGERVPQLKIQQMFKAPKWGMLNMKRDTVFRRFEITLDELRSSGELRLDMRYATSEAWPIYDNADRIKTAEEWISQIGGGDDKDRNNCWNLWYRQRLPPAHFLPTLSDPRQDIRQGKRKRDGNSG